MITIASYGGNPTPTTLQGTITYATYSMEKEHHLPSCLLKETLLMEKKSGKPVDMVNIHFSTGFHTTEVVS